MNLPLNRIAAFIFSGLSLLSAVDSGRLVLAQVLPAGKVSVLYTGRSLGALGVRRAQDEHELLTEQALIEKKTFKLVSHLAWRAPGITVFLASDEPAGDEILDIMARRSEAERVEMVPALLSDNVLLFQDPWRIQTPAGIDPEKELLKMIERNPRRHSDFLDLVPISISVSRLRTAKGKRVFIVEHPGAIWPTDRHGWSEGEMNRVDIGETRLFELPFNIGGIGPKSTMLKELRGEDKAIFILADLGHQDGDMGMTRSERAHLDFTALQELGYRFVVPYDFELALGQEELKKLKTDFPSISLLAANLSTKEPGIFLPSMVVDTAGLKIGLIGLVNPSIKDRLPRASLVSFSFDVPVIAARKEVDRLRKLGVSSIVILSNMDPADNAVIAQEIPGIDAIVADMPVRNAPETVRVRVELPDRPFVRPGTPALVARSASNGLGIGRLDLEFRARTDTTGNFLAAVSHSFNPITDRIQSDTTLVRKIQKMASVRKRPRGELMFPAFTDLVARYPDLADFDEITKRGRVSKNMWEMFMARRVRVKGNVEVAVIRRLDQFPPLIGKLHENEIMSWLWTEDELVMADIPGADLKALLNSDSRKELVSSGIDLAKNMVLGHRIDDAAFYRVATTDVLFDGGRSRFFQRARRVRRTFDLDPADGTILSRDVESDGRALSVKDFILNDLKRVRSESQGEAQIDRVALMLKPDPPLVNLFSFTFARPTLWTSLNQVSGNEGYEKVPESRVLAKNALVAGTSGRFVLSRERQASALDLGMSFAYAVQRINDSGNRERVESADDYKIDLTLRPGPRTNLNKKSQPFLRGLFDSEFSPTENTATGAINPQQLSLRAVAGFLLYPGPRWRNADIGLVLENDFGRPNPQAGIQSRSIYEFRFGGGRSGSLTYRMNNDFTYFFPAPLDTEANLSLRYNMVNDLLIPLVDELSLTVTADLLFFRGKVEQTSKPGLSTQLRVGITYDRLWKPKYQPFF